MAWAYVLWATAGGKNFSLSVIWNCGVTLRRTPRGSGCVCSSFSFHSPYTSCTSVVIRSTSIDLKPECNEVNYDHDDPEKDIPDPIQAQNDLKRLNGDLNCESSDLKNQAMQDGSVGAQRDFELQLIDVIRQNPSLTYKAYGEKLSVSQATVKRLVAKLKVTGSIRREGSQRKGTWIITDDE